jgi:hypothetical protein
MPSPIPTKKTVADLKASILNPALTSHFECSFNPPGEVRKWINQRTSAGIGNGYNDNLISLSCSEASLPGSSLATHEINNDFTGVTERHVYRRQYDDRADFTFYVDHDYNVLQFFENWMSYIVGEEISGGVLVPNYSYRVNFPDDYKTEIYIKKFERDYSGRVLQYRFLNAYPISINSMPVSYDSSQLLKCTVSFNYSRYVIGGGEVLVPPKEAQTPAEQAANISPGNSEFSSSTTSEEYYGQLPPVESGLPYVGRNRGPLAPFSGI